MLYVVDCVIAYLVIYVSLGLYSCGCLSLICFSVLSILATILPGKSISKMTSIVMSKTLNLNQSAGTLQLTNIRLTAFFPGQPG